MISSGAGSFIYRQRGMTIIVGMIMLLLLTIIGLAGINAANLEEHMAGNQRDRALAFQSAEAALRAAEKSLDGVSAPTWNTPGYGDQVASGGDSTYWDTFNWSGTGLRVDLGMTSVAAQPQYYVEKINVQFGSGTSGSAVDFSSGTESAANYRITARAVGASSSTVVVLQTTYKVL